MTHETCSTCSTYNPNSERWYYSGIRSGDTEKIDGPAYMVEDKLEKSTHKNEQLDLGI